MKSSSFLNTLLTFAIGLAFLAGLFCIGFSGYQNITQDTTGLSAPKVFNQGNAAARQGKTGEAIADYERAKILDPSDANITANLNWVREKAALPASTGWLDSAVGWASPNTWSWIGCMALILIGVSAIAQIAFLRTHLWTYGGLIAGFAIIALCLADAYDTVLKSAECVVVTSNAAAHVSPTTNGETSFKLPSGQIVIREGQYDNFVLVADSNGRSGWVNKSDIISIVPKS